MKLILLRTIYHILKHQLTLHYLVFEGGLKLYDKYEELHPQRTQDQASLSFSH